MNPQISSKPSSEFLDRRLFLQKSGAGGLALLTMGLGKGLPVMAGPFEGADFEKLVPSDKRLSEAWIRSLYERGEAEWFTGDELKYIGMPVGGICCGQVYLSGDGRLWHWDIFNQNVLPKNLTRGPHYKHPMPALDTIDLGFSLRIQANGKEIVRKLDKTGFPEVRFRGAYPIGFVDFADKELPVEVSLEAFSPFTPLDVDGSSLPLTVMRYTLRNTSPQATDVSLAGAFTNPILLYSGTDVVANIVNKITKSTNSTCLHCTAESFDEEDLQDPRPDIVFEDFESPTYEGWVVEGTAFGDGPTVASKMPAYQGKVGADGKRLVNSHRTQDGESCSAADAHTGVMTSRQFKIERRFVHALVGGGANANQTALQVLVGDEVVAKVSGGNHNKMTSKSINLAQHEGKIARLRILDDASGSWGNIGVDQIVFSDKAKISPVSLEEQADMGDMTLALLDDGEGIISSAAISDSDMFSGGIKVAHGTSSERPRGAIGKSLTLEPGEKAVVSFAIGWRFPNRMNLPEVQESGHYYATRFSSSLEVIDHHAAIAESTYERTRLWHDTWYDSSLPYWLLDRTFINTSTLATTTCYRMGNGRFWGWEGVGCCLGTCQHVWHYAQAVGRVFPELERILREQIDFGSAYLQSGAIHYRGPANNPKLLHEATDGLCGTVLRVYREHTMSADSAFLERIWPRVKQSIKFLIGQDANNNGVLEGKQFNTLDSAWYGPMAWISSLYLAVLRSGAAMAREMQDESFAKHCDGIVAIGSKWLAENLFDGEYFFHKRDPKHADAFGVGIGCHIDQVMGQGWSHQLGLGRVLPKDETRSALKALWRYNFTPDVGPYRQQFKAGRWYAMPGEAGLLMCTFPKGGETEARGGKPGHGFAGYLNECMNGFEYQAAGHMVAEGLIKEGLSVTRAVHDRYAPSRRNPYNEIECGDHYARSMASYGVFVSVCGYDYHGPKGRIGFAPRLKPEDFRAPFIAAEGWGSFSQSRRGSKQSEILALHFGKLNLQQMSFELPDGMVPKKLTVNLEDTELNADSHMVGSRVVIDLADVVTVSAGQSITVQIKS